MSPNPAAADRTERRRDRILAALIDTEATLAGDPPTLRMVGAEGLRRMPVDPAMLDGLIEAGLVERSTDPATGAIRLSATAAATRRIAAPTGADPFRAAHGDLVRRRLDPEGPELLIDEAESPLGRLARHRDRDGHAFLSPARVAAGERLRRDFTVARMMPTVTSNWSTVRLGGSGRGGAGDLTDRALAARDRVLAALAAVDGDLADLLVDVCCLLEGLETIEARRRWPARSAKVVLDIALGRLADHYGLADRVRGRDRSPQILGWGTPDHRPTVTGAIRR